MKVKYNSISIRRAASLAAVMFSFLFNTKAQQVTTASGDSLASIQNNSNYDPIVEMLDSLVNLNYVQRLNFASSGTQQNNFQPYEIPTYSDEIYAKRLEKIQSPIPLAFNQQVKEYIDLYAVHKRGLTERVMGLAQLYFPLYEQVLDQNDLPIEFKYLSVVESALNATAVSRMGATGLWQFMLQTGKMYNLKVNSFIDERRDAHKSTQAACQYFKNMYDIYHDWLLVIAAYNCGAGNVNKAIIRSGGKMNFWEISSYLPRETRGYVPAFIAVTYLMNYSTEHNLTAVPPVISFHEADTVWVDQKVSLHTIADAIDVPYEMLTYLNPVYKRGIIPDMDEPQVLRLPVNKIYTYITNLDKIFQPVGEPSFAKDDGTPANLMDYSTRAVKKYHVVKKGEILAGIADKYNCTIADIKRWNKIRTSKVFKGQRLLVYVSTKQRTESRADITKKSSAKVASNNIKAKAVSPATRSTSINNSPGDLTNKSMARISNASASKIVWHIVQPGDTLWNIARSYDGASVEQIKAINNLQSNELKPGTRLKVKISG